MRAYTGGAKSTGPMDELRPYNNILRGLQESDYELIAPHLLAAQHSVSDVIYNEGDDVEAVYFSCGPAMVSFLISSEHGRDVETVLIGREVAVGGISFAVAAVAAMGAVAFTSTLRVTAWCRTRRASPQLSHSPATIS